MIYSEFPLVESFGAEGRTVALLEVLADLKITHQDPDIPCCQEKVSNLNLKFLSEILIWKMIHYTMPKNQRAELICRTRYFGNFSKVLKMSLLIMKEV